MSNRTTVSRIFIVSVGCLFVAAAAVAGMRLRNWAPADACLFCVTPEADATSAANALDGRGSGGANGSAANHAGAGGGFSASALPPAATAANSSAASGRVASSGSRRSWQPWTNVSGSLRSYSGDGGAPSASRGGLWRLMNLSRTGGSHGTQEATVTQNLEKPAPQVRTPRKPSSPAPPAAKPPAAPSASAPPAAAPPTAAPPTSPDPLPTPTATPTPPAPPTAFVPPTDPFHEHDKPLPDPFAAPAPNGPLDPGNNGPGPGLPGGRDPSPTPEPGSIFLIGTGLVGIFGALRQRRLL